MITLLLQGFLALSMGNAQSHGCTDLLALNYHAGAAQNDGSCIYPDASISVLSSWLLPPSMVETSGLIVWNHKIWTHNDRQDLKLYAFDTLDVFNYETFELTGTINIDWEEIAQDEHYVYVGDFGNNYNGNRTNLQILLVEKTSLLSREPLIDTIQFSYALQDDLSGSGLNNTDYDCEAFVVGKDSLYLFTKEWVSKKTSVYVLPKEPGNYVARHLDTYDVQGLITGATYLEHERLLVLSGYNMVVQPFLYLFYDFQGRDFFGGNKRKLRVNLPLHQVEAITTKDGLFYYMTNEALLTAFVTVSQKLHTLDLTEYLGHYITDYEVGVEESVLGSLHLYPNPSRSYLRLESADLPVGTNYKIMDMHGRILLKGKTGADITLLYMGELPPGVYILNLDTNPVVSKKIMRY